MAEGNGKSVGKPATMPGANGGTLMRGYVGQRNGRPSSIVREQLRGLLTDRIPIIAAIADGEAVRKSRVPLASLLRFARCPTCDGGFEATCAPEDIPFVEIEGKVSASPSDRIKALEMAGRYGLGPQKGHDEALVSRLARITGEVFGDDPRLEELHHRWIEVIGAHLRGED